jgi:CheY-like chemotaxis protein
MYAEVLTLAGFRVEQAENGAVALEMTKRLVPAAVVMDLSLPVMDGWDATRSIKDNPRTRHVRVVAISAHSMPTHVARAKDAGADAFLAKPCLPDDLVDTLRRLLEEKPAPKKQRA